MNDISTYWKHAQKTILRIYRNNKLYTHIAIISIVSIVLLIYLQYYYLPAKREREILNSLHPELRGKAKRFLNYLRRAGIGYNLISGFRTFQEQADLYEQGRSEPGKIITRAKPGQSYHNYGLAIDVTPEDPKDLNVLVNVAKSFGFEWGGEWENFEDTPHFQYTFGYDWDELLQKRKNGETDINGYVKI